MLKGKQLQSYTDFHNSARYNETLDPRTTLMIHLASSMAVACYP